MGWLCAVVSSCVKKSHFYIQRGPNRLIFMVLQMWWKNKQEVQKGILVPDIVSSGSVVPGIFGYKIAIY